MGPALFSLALALWRRLPSPIPDQLDVFLDDGFLRRPLSAAVGLLVGAALAPTCRRWLSVLRPAWRRGDKWHDPSRFNVAVARVRSVSESRAATGTTPKCYEQARGT
jgi:hypothetical protein